MTRSDDGLRFSRRAFVLGSAGAAGVAGAASSAAAQETVTIDMTDDLVFDPDEETVAPGTTVVWENVGQIGHSVTAYEDEIPDEASFFASGDFEDEATARRSYPQRGDVAGGESYQHTFEVEGEYNYFCIPHETVGMVATLTVTSEPPDEGGGVVRPTVPESARVVALLSSAALVVVGFLTYFFMKYGGDYGESRG